MTTLSNDQSRIEVLATKAVRLWCSTTKAHYCKRAEVFTTGTGADGMLLSTPLAPKQDTISLVTGFPGGAAGRRLQIVQDYYP